MIAIPTDMRRLLENCGLPWRVEEGTRHRLLIVDERMLTILPKSNTALKRNGPRHRNAMSHIKRGLRDLEQRR